MLRPRRLALLLALAGLFAGAVVAGCGSSGAAGDADPAAAVPRDALVYLEAVLRPEGDAREGALDAAGKILDTGDPERRIRELLQKAFASGDVRADYARDIEPWLGDRAGLWVGRPSRGGQDPPVAAVVDARDLDEAQSKLHRLIRGRLTKRQAGGEDYEVTRDGDALAFRDDQVIAGQEAAVRRILTLHDGSDLAGSDGYRKAIADLDPDRLATFYLDTAGLLDAAAASDPEAAAQIGPLRAFAGRLFLRPVAASLAADGDRIAIESLTSAAAGGAGRLGGLAGGGAAPLLKGLPGDSWAAYGIPAAGRTLRSTFQALAGAFGGAAAAEELRREYGIDLERDVFSWMGDVGVFARGQSVRSVDGGMVVQITDERRAAAAFGKLVGLARTRGGLDAQPVRVPGADVAFDLGVRDTPKPLVVARGHGRMALAFGRAAAADALDPSRELQDSDAYAGAKEALGNGIEPSLLVSVPAILALVESSGEADADFERAKPYLDGLGVVATGARREGDKVRSRFVIGLR